MAHASNRCYGRQRNKRRDLNDEFVGNGVNSSHCVLYQPTRAPVSGNKFLRRSSIAKCIWNFRILVGRSVSANALVSLSDASTLSSFLMRLLSHLQFHAPRSQAHAEVTHVLSFNSSGRIGRRMKKRISNMHTQKLVLNVKLNFNNEGRQQKQLVTLATTTTPQLRKL